VSNHIGQTKPKDDYRITYKDFLFGIMSIAWRLPTIMDAGQKLRNLNPESNDCFGTHLEYNATKYPNRNAVLYEDIKYTHKELNEWINRYANYFLSLGLKKGDVINVLLENRPEMLFIIGGVSKIGVIASLINTNQREASLIHSLKLNPAKAYIIGEELFKAFEEVKSKLNLTSKVKIFFLEDKGKMDLPKGYINLRQVVKDYNQNTPPTLAKICGKDTYIYIFTSGTTGLPKAVPIRNIHSISSIYSFGRLVMNMQPEDVFYITTPLAHSQASVLSWPAAIGGGSTIALSSPSLFNNGYQSIKFSDHARLIKFSPQYIQYFSSIFATICRVPSIFVIIDPDLDH